jgi:hypothetical protein
VITRHRFSLSAAAPLALDFAKQPHAQ